MQKPSLLITGGLGFIGCNLVQHLHQYFDITVLDNRSSGSKNLPFVSEKAKVVDADITCLEDCEQVLQNADYVVHLAAKGNVIQSIADPMSNLQSNLIGTVNLLRACEGKSIKRFVFSSTGGALMGNCELPVNESSVPEPISPYGASKMACEGYLSAFSEILELPVTILRFGNVYGRYCQHKIGVFNKILHAIKADSEITLFNHGRASRDFVHAIDICKGIGLALTCEQQRFERFHLGTARETCIAELVQIFEKVTGSPMKTIHAEARKGEVVFNFASYERAKLKLGFEPQIDLQEGIADLWQWYNGKE